MKCVNIVSELYKMCERSISVSGKHLTVSIGPCFNITILRFLLTLNCFSTKVNECTVQIFSLFLVDVSMVLHDLALQVPTQGCLWNNKDIPGKVKDRHQLPILCGTQSCVQGRLGLIKNKTNPILYIDTTYTLIVLVK